MDVIGTIGSLFVVGAAKSAQKIMFSRAFSTVFYVAYLLLEHHFLFWLNLGCESLVFTSYLFTCRLCFK